MGNMKANRKFREGQEAVSAVIGVILMVAITVAIAATVYVYVSGMIGGQSGIKATVTMQQSGAAVLITQIQNGPVKNSTASIVVVNMTSGLPEGSGMIHASANGNVEGTNVITLSGITTEAGQRYTVQFKYGTDLVGTCTYIVP